MTWWHRFSRTASAAPDSNATRQGRKKALPESNDYEGDPLRTREAKGEGPSRQRAITTHGDLGLAVTGDNNHVTNVVVNSAPTSLSSAYREEIRHLAAAHFQGREAELAAMNSFAIGDDPVKAGYWRWLAPAWSGKTALMAQFSLNPPDGVDVLAFFITARMAGRSDRTAFLATLQEQLRAYLQDSDVDCTSYGGFHEALQRAAEQAVACGRRLVLVIDGMDEDSGVESAVSGYSIAGLLPRCPPEGLHVIVAGRPNPPVPGDVAPDHVLRSPSINHCLTESTAARAVREDAERSLDALIAAEGISLDLVGLTAAAGGGLSAADLSLLTGEHTARRVEVVLGGATGRSFELRPAQWAVCDNAPVPLYSFAHQEILTGARQLLPVALLEGYRDRIHEFVGHYQGQRWPADTPEYALSGYSQMLRELHDARRLTELATDLRRHALLWQVTGSDIRAFTEINDAFTLLRNSTEPDLPSCVRLSYCRDQLKQKALNVPVHAILAWAKSGHIRKAVALASVRVELVPHEGFLFGAILQGAISAGETELVLRAAQAIPKAHVKDSAFRSIVTAYAAERKFTEAVDLTHCITDPELHAMAQIGVSEALLKAGQADEAIRLTHTASEVARTITDPYNQSSVLTNAAKVLAKTSERDQAANLARAAAETAFTIPDPEEQAFALTEAARASAEAKNDEEAASFALTAVEVARTIVDPEEQAFALTESAGELAKVGNMEGVENITQMIPTPELRTSLLVAVSKTLVEAEKTAEAVKFARTAAELARTIAIPNSQVSALVNVAQAFIEAGLTEEVETLTCTATEISHTITDPDDLAKALVAIVRALARANRTEQAAKLTHTISQPEDQAEAMTVIARALAEAGKTDQAVELARIVSEPEGQAEVMMVIARALAEASKTDQAGEIGLRVAEVARTTIDSDRKAKVLANAALVLAEVGMPEEAADLAHTATEVARSITNPKWRATGLVSLTHALIEAGRPDEATNLAHTAAEVARSIIAPDDRARELGKVAQALARAEKTDEAITLAHATVEVARTVPNRHWRATALRNATRALAQAGGTGEATKLAHTIAEPDIQSSALVDIAQVLIKAGQADEATRLAHAAVEVGRTITDPEDQADALAKAAETLAKTGDTDQAVSLSRTAAEIARTITDPEDRADALAKAAEALAEIGDTDQAIEIAHTAAEVAHTINNPQGRSTALKSVVRALAHTGNTDEATNLARTITEPDDHASALAIVVEELVKAGHTAEVGNLTHTAAAVARTTLNVQWRAIALRNVAQALAHTGNTDEATNLAGTITEPTHQASALVTIARTHGRSSEGRSLLAWALSLESLSRITDELPSLAPEVLDEAVRCMRQSL
ncbi:hypothetical protein [Streptomyces sp. NPDC050416]|uniref:hypothetical protein n=1 Tax=Streptomyces sp. NPDC050416 TaxID=3365611 RepID=UPI0037B6AE2F